MRAIKLLAKGVAPVALAAGAVGVLSTAAWASPAEAPTAAAVVPTAVTQTIQPASLAQPTDRHWGRRCVNWRHNWDDHGRSWDHDDWGWWGPGHRWHRGECDR